MRRADKAAGSSRAKYRISRNLRAGRDPGGSGNRGHSRGGESRVSARRGGRKRFYGTGAGGGGRLRQRGRAASGIPVRGPEGAAVLSRFTHGGNDQIRLQRLSRSENRIRE